VVSVRQPPAEDLARLIREPVQAGHAFAAIGERRHSPPPRAILSSLVLMRWEAEALTRAMRTLRKQGLLPMHDVLIVRRSDYEATGKAPIAAFMEEVEVTPLVR
jgi:hypothetical protein